MNNSDLSHEYDNSKVFVLEETCICSPLSFLEGT